MSVSYWQDKKQKHKSYDFAVVGAGIAGVSQCYWLQKKFPEARIALIERGTVASGASGKNAGFVTCGSIEHLIKMRDDFGLEKALRIWKFSEKNHALLKEEIIQDSALSVDYKTTGSCTVAPNEERWSDYKKFIGEIRTQVDMSEIDEKEIRKDFSLTGFVGAAFYKKDGSIHPLKLIQLILSRLKIDLFENCELFKIEEDNSLVTLQTNLGSFTANKVVLTLNAYLPLLLPDYKSILKPGRGQILTTEPVAFQVRGPCYFTKSLCYFRQLTDGSLLVGGFRNLDADNEETCLDEINPKIQESLGQFVRDHFPIKNIKISHQWSGAMSFSKDGQLLLGARAAGSHVYIHAGCSGHGMGLNFNAAKVLSEHLTGASPLPDYFNIARFQN